MWSKNFTHEPTNDLDIETLEVLEEYLDNFAGIVIAVSHDRYFLDRTVDRIFAFEGNGRLKQYEGGFSDYYEKRVSSIYNASENGTLGGGGSKSGSAGGEIGGGAAGSAAKAVGSDNGKPKYVKDRSNQVKFTYMEQREFETIDDDIAKLEERIAELDVEIEKSATQYGKLRELMEQKTEAEQALEEKMERWMYLNELAEKIAASKS